MSTVQVKQPIYVIKRDNTRQLFDIEKIRKYIELVSDGCNNISIDSILFSLSASIYNNIRTTLILSTLIKIASDKISLSSPDYNVIASKLFINEIRREVWNSFYVTDTLYNRVSSRSCYDSIIFEKYTKDEFDYIDKNVVNYNNDYLLSYSGIRQFYDKYLIKHRITNQLMELPQEANILICMYMFMNYKDKRERMHYISRMYYYLSHLVISLPTPIYAGVRTKLRSFSSCCVLDCGDNTDEILTTNYYIGKAVTNRFGIGINVNKVRGIGASISNGAVIHTGIVPFLKMFESSTKGFMQNGIRGGGGTVSCPFWHYEIMTILELKNNKGVVENRVRGLDYSIGLNKFFITRVINDEDITLFSSEEVPLLSNDYTYDFETFTKVYEEYEKRYDIRKITMKARELMLKICKERFETGRIYIYYMDNMNMYGVFKESIFSSNLCQEIAIPTKPVNINTGEGLIAICILSCINVGRLNLDNDIIDIYDVTNDDKPSKFSIKTDEIKEVCDIIVRFLDEMIDYQTYICPQIERCAIDYRPLGIGISDLFHLIAKRKMMYDTLECRQFVHELTEKFQYYLLKSSCNLAKEKGKCNAFDKSKYSDGVLPIDNYKETINTLVDNMEYSCDWEALRKEIKTYGLRHTCLSAIPPTASSCSISNSTPGIDPPRHYITNKMSKYGMFSQIIPEFEELKGYYTTQKDIKNEEYFKLIGVIQKFIDQGISTNSYYMYTGEVGYNDIMKEIINGFRFGLKSLYYLNNNKGVDEDITMAFSTEGISRSESSVSCDGGACSI